VPAVGLAACVSGRARVRPANLELDTFGNAGSAPCVPLGLDNTLISQAAHGSVDELLGHPELPGQINLPRENVTGPQLAISDLLSYVGLDLPGQGVRLGRQGGGDQGTPVGAVSTPIEYQNIGPYYTARRRSGTIGRNRKQEREAASTASRSIVSVEYPFPGTSPR
jgi:hypothetical protein